MAALPQTSNKNDDVSHYLATTNDDGHAMLDAIGVQSIDKLFDVVPPGVRFPHVDLPDPLSEAELLRELRRMSSTNANAHTHRIFLGAGAYNHFVPSAVDAILRRSEFYTAYTPYQPEIAQGTLQAIFEYQPHWIDRLTPTDYRALTPLIYSHVNPYGFIRLDMTQLIPIDEAEAA